MTTRVTIERRLLEGPARMSELRSLTGRSYRAVSTAVSRLRDAGYDIHTVYGSGDPKYEILRTPESLSFKEQPNG